MAYVYADGSFDCDEYGRKPSEGAVPTPRRRIDNKDQVGKRYCKPLDDSDSSCLTSSSADAKRARIEDNELVHVHTAKKVKLNPAFKYVFFNAQSSYILSRFSSFDTVTFVIGP